jgi:hypothetical protein
MYKLTSSTFNRDWFVYKKYNKGISEQSSIIELIRDNSKIQRVVISVLEPSLEKWLKDFFKKILIDITIVSEKKYLYDSENEKLSNDVKSIFNDETNLEKEDLFNNEFRSEFRMALALYSTHLWFISAKGYKFWMFRYVIPFEAFIRYGYIILHTIFNDHDKIYNEPFILQYGQFEYAVISREMILYCSQDIFKALWVWSCEMRHINKLRILPIRTHTEIKKMEYYYIWVYVWKKIYFPKELDLIDFFTSLSDDIVNIGELFYTPEKKDEKTEKKDVVIDDITVQKEIDTSEKKEVFEKMFGRKRKIQ